MKVLLVNNTFGNFGGGSEKVTYETGNILREKGVEVYFFASNKKPYYEENYEYSFLFPNEFKKNRLYSLASLFYNYDAEKKLSTLIQIIKPDVVHINCIQHNLTVSVLAACKKNKVPIVLTFHDSHFACPAATLMKGKGEFCNDMNCLKGNITSCINNRCFSDNLIKSSIVGFDFLFKKMFGFYGMADAIICPSNYLFNIAVKSGLDINKLFVVNNCVSEEYTKTIPVYSNKNYFLYVGRLVKEKGGEYLLEAFKDMPEIELRIIGDGPYRSHLEKLAVSLNMDNVKFLGFMEKSELENEYKGAVATILPSICSEVFGLTIVESFAYGKPVIASKIGGIPEVVKDSINGILVPPKNAKEIKKAVLELNNNKELAIKMGKNARKTLENNFNSEIYFQRLNNIYKKVINNYSYNCFTG